MKTPADCRVNADIAGKIRRFCGDFGPKGARFASNFWGCKSFFDVFLRDQVKGNMMRPAVNCQGHEVRPGKGN